MYMLYFTKILEMYRHELLINIIPFWTKNTIDKKYGGVLSAITDDAQIVTTDNTCGRSAQSGLSAVDYIHNQGTDQ